MEAHMETPYQKLTRTPLAQKYQMCGQEPKTIAIILGIISLIIDVLPNFVLAYILFNWSDTKSTSSSSKSNDPFDDPFFKKHNTRTSAFDDTPRKIGAGVGIFFGLIQLIGIIVLFVGACRNESRYFYCWCCSMMFQSIMGRFSFLFLMLIGGVSWAPLIILLLICDIFLVIAMFYCMGQISAVERNKRYMSEGAMRYNVQPATDPQAGQMLIPSSAYPHQV